MSKYLVFKGEDAELVNQALKNTFNIGAPEPVEDAVVIRRQDVFAAPAFYTYANSIDVALRVLRFLFPLQSEETVEMATLQETADYFHQQSELAATAVTKKFPD